MRELVYYVAVSLDGYIAGPDGQFDAFPVEGDHMDRILEEYADTVPTHLARQLGTEPDGHRFDAVVMGANTHAIGLPDHPSPYQHLEQVVFTHRRLEPAENLRSTAADPVEVVTEMKQQDGADIWLCGGGNLAAQLRSEIDRIVLKRNPVQFGDGIPLFAPGDYAPVPFDRVSSRDFDSGVSLVEYVRRR